MKESKFIAQNKKNWNDFEKDLRFKQNKAARLSKLFIQVTDDLSYARTFYKNRLVRVYLNGLAQKLFNGFYRNQKSNAKGFVNFWTNELPYKMYEARKEFLISLLVFIGAFSIGLLSSIYDKDFARLVLGNEYINMTLENIKNNNPMAVYKTANQVDMFLGITVNNLYVSLSTFIFGFFFSIGTIFRLIYNGIMLGTFQYFFIERGLFWESFLTVWQHGTLEISCIIIAGAAGITLGKGLLFPGTFSRTESFKQSAFRGLKIFVGIIPVIIMAGFIESFFTRYTEMGTIPRLMVILISLSFIIAYFVIYPRIVYKRSIIDEFKTEKLTYREPFNSDFSKILTSEEILGNTVEFFNRYKLKLAVILIMLSTVHAISAILYEKYASNGINLLSIQFFNSKSAFIHLLLGVFDIIYFLLFISSSISKELVSKTGTKRLVNFKSVFSALIISAIIIGLIYVLKWFVLLAFVFVLPILCLIYFTAFIENLSIFTSIGKAINLLSQSWGKLMWGSIKQFLLFGILFLIFNTPLVWQYLESLYSSISYSSEVLLYVKLFLQVFIIIGLISVYFIFQITTTVYSYFAFKEIVYSDNLLKRIEIFGNRNSIFGFEKE